MVFSSIIFVLVFLPIVIFLYKMLSMAAPYYSKGLWNNKGVWMTRFFLVGASILFYAWGEPKMVWVLIASTILNYAFGVLIGNWLGQRRAKIALIVGIVLNLGMLGYFKYMNFFTENGVFFLNEYFSTNLDLTWVTKIALPLGISFFTFQGLSYLVDIYKGEIKATTSFVEFACYQTMFPQLVAGPIVRYSSIEPELHELKQSPDKFMQGATRFIVGLAKKVFIADSLGIVADAAFECPIAELSTAGAWVGIVCYTLQIYYDFSAYSDMAIGLGKIFGFTFPENFNYPYISRSITEFWKRWHMSLSQWLRDYLYIPLGGNRKGKGRTYFNLFIVFLLCGLWHGASWVFIAWGVYNGLILIIERLMPSMPGKLPRVLQHIYTIFLFMMGWVVFRAENMSHAVDYYKILFGGGSEGGYAENKVWLMAYSGDVYLALLLGVLFAYPISQIVKNKWISVAENSSATKGVIMESLRYTGVLVLLIIILMPLFGATYNAFIYFRF